MIDERRPISPQDIQLRQAVRADAPLILWLEEVGMKEYATAIWGSWRPSATVEVIDVSNHQIVEIEGQAIGCIAITRLEELLNLDKIYLDSAFRNLGIGTHVLQRVIEMGVDLGLPVSLSVLRTNPALRFYLRAGFEVTSETTERRTLKRAPSGKHR